MTSEISLNVLDEGRVLDIAPQTVVIAGFTGRNPVEVKAHVHELASLGVPAPDSIPAFWSVSPELLVTDDTIFVPSPETSGEAEPVLIRQDDQWYVGVGSDHTARDIERVDFQKSKQACPKVLSTDVVNYGSVTGEWDNAVLESWAEEDGEELLCQRGTLSALLRVPDILDGVRAHLGDSESRLVVFLGTVPRCQASYVFGTRFRAQLRFPAQDIALECQYRVIHRERSR